MNPQTENLNANPDPTLQTTYNPLSAMREGEKVLCVIRRHPIGIIGVYISAILVIGVVLAAVTLLPGHINNLSSQNKAAMLFGALIIVIITLLYTYVAHVIFIGNKWILTDDSLTQVTQTGLFRKHSSQLSLANLEDITADQNGLLQSMIGFGDLRAETAGERSKFVFPFCPKPNDYARRILQAREAFIMDNPEKAKRANDKLEVPRYDDAPAGPQIDPQQYQQFLQYQQMLAQQQASSQPMATTQPAAVANDVTQNQTPALQPVPEPTAQPQPPAPAANPPSDTADEEQVQPPYQPPSQ